MTIEEAIKHCEKIAEEQESLAQKFEEWSEWEKDTITECKECASEHRQLAEWLRELKAYREFADWLVGAVLEEDWEDSSDFYAEVLCRKLTKLGHLKVEDGKYVEVNADG